ncbi:hypothetical protein RMQ97_09225 [Maricaulis sp. D1M11]|uniref:hypothetical protein n=1 Tax=Maricaulis sp. D1M11 TaxID=3076117 RepID=UPI0039B53D74
MTFILQIDTLDRNLDSQAAFETEARGDVAQYGDLCAAGYNLTEDNQRRNWYVCRTDNPRGSDAQVTLVNEGDAPPQGMTYVCTAFLRFGDANAEAFDIYQSPDIP